MKLIATLIDTTPTRHECSDLTSLFLHSLGKFSSGNRHNRLRNIGNYLLCNKKYFLCSFLCHFSF